MVERVIRAADGSRLALQAPHYERKSASWFLKNGGLLKIAVFVISFMMPAIAMAACASSERDKRYAERDEALLYVITWQRCSPSLSQRVQRLLDMGANPNKRYDKHGRKSFYYACKVELSDDPVKRAEQEALVQILYCQEADDPKITSVRMLSDDMLELLVILDREISKSRVALDAALCAKPNTAASWLPDELAEIIRGYIGAPETIQEHPLKVRSARVCDALLSYSGANHMGSILEVLYVGGLVNIQADHCRTPLHHAVWKDRHGIIKLLLEGGLNIGAQDSSGWTPLHYAAWDCYEQTVRLLLENKADTEIKAEDGWTPLMYAVARSDDSHGVIVRLLLESGANCSAYDNDGLTALHHAASRARTHKAALLLQYKANINAKDNKGRTPLDLAKNRHGFEDVEQLLLAHTKWISCGCIVA